MLSEDVIESYVELTEHQTRFLSGYDTCNLKFIAIFEANKEVTLKIAARKLADHNGWLPMKLIVYLDRDVHKMLKKHSEVAGHYLMQRVMILDWIKENRNNYEI